MSVYADSHCAVSKQMLRALFLFCYLPLTSSASEFCLRFLPLRVEMLGAALKHNKAEGFWSSKTGSVAACY